MVLSGRLCMVSPTTTGEDKMTAEKDEAEEIDYTNEQNSGGGSGQMIPKERLDAVLGEVHNLRAEVERLKTPPKSEAEPAKTFTRTELSAAVESGQITQIQADRILDDQAQAATAKTVEQTVNTALATRDRVSTVQSDMGEYIKVRPELKDPSSKLRIRVQEEYSYLVGTLGQAAGAATELAAVRAVLGPTTNMRKVGKVEAVRESHSEGSGGGADVDAGAGEKGKPKPVKLTQREKDYYSPRVGPGKMYSTWDAVQEELQYARPDVRAKHA